jgi:retinol dehydrogenase-12
VHIVTGGYAGCGQELVKIFYQKNATIYVAGRSKEKADKSIAAIKELFPSSKGKIEFLKVDFADLASIKPATEEFMSKEKRLDTLTNNAGVMTPPKGSKDAHGHEQQIGTNALGSWVFSELLLPILKSTAASSPAGTVRVTFAASLAVWLSPKGGVTFTEDGAPVCHSDQNHNYAQSKAANVFLASEFARRYGKDGIISVSWNPGNLRTELQRHMAYIANMILNALLTFPAKFGGYTELYAACSPDITASQNGVFIAPWGRIYHTRDDIAAALKTEEEGGTGQAKKFVDWCEKESAMYK